LQDCTVIPGMPTNRLKPGPPCAGLIIGGTDF
jgi:hypothetical protein